MDSKEHILQMRSDFYTDYVLNCVKNGSFNNTKTEEQDNEIKKIVNFALAIKCGYDITDDGATLLNKLQKAYDGNVDKDLIKNLDVVLNVKEFKKEIKKLEKQESKVKPQIQYNEIKRIDYNVDFGLSWSAVIGFILGVVLGFVL